MLSRPQIMGPVSELTRAIRVRNQFAGATVTIVATTFVPSVGFSARALTKDTAGSSDTRLELPPGVALQAVDPFWKTPILLVAVQEFGGDSSPAPADGMPLAVPIQRAPSDLEHVGFASTLWQCGQYLWLKGGVPGAEGTVFDADFTPIGSGTFFESEGARFRLNEPLWTDPVAARQSTPALGPGPTTGRIPQPLPGNRNDRLPAPTIDPLPLACQSAVRVGNIFDGAEVVLDRSDGKRVTHLRVGFDLSALWMIMSQLSDGEELIFHQEVSERCERKTFQMRKVTVGPQGPVPVPVIGPLCAGAPVVIIRRLVPNAQVELNVNGTVVRGQTPPDATTLNMIVDPLSPGTASVRQLQCSTWSAPMAVPIDAAPAQVPKFKIIEPLYACSSIVTLAGVHEGAIVMVESKRHGPIGGPIPCDTGTDPFVISVAPALTSPDEISVTQWACGGAPTSATALVQTTAATPPRIRKPVYIGTSTVSIEQLLLGAILTVTVVDKNGEVLQAITVAGATDVVLPVTFAAPLKEGDVITARQSLCGDNLSRTSDPVAVKLVPLTADWWTWDGVSPVHHDWNREYTVSGTFTNKGTSPITNLHFSYWENITSPGDLSPGSVNPGAQTKGAFPLLKQNWSWLTPGVWVPHEPFSKTFYYHIDITGTDLTGNNYPVVSTQPFVVIVAVSLAKYLAASQAEALAIAALALGAAAAAALLGIFSAPAAVPLGIAAGAAAAGSAAAGAVALDPPEPDPNFRTRVLLPSSIPLDLGADFPALAQLLDTLTQVPAIERAKSTMQSRLLGAAQAGTDEWVAVHRQDLVGATARQRAFSAAAPGVLTSATSELGPIAMGLEAALPDFRHDMLISGFPSDVVSSGNLSVDQVAALDILARSTEVCYPTGDLIASLHEATQALVSFVDTLTQPT